MFRIILAPLCAGLFFVSSDAKFEWCDSVTGDGCIFQRTLFPRIKLLHLLPCYSLAFLGVRGGDAIGEVLFLNAEGESSESVIICLLAQLRILIREGKEPVFEAGVIGDDCGPLVSLVKVYFGRFMRFLNACYHSFQKSPVFPSCEKHPYFLLKKPRSSSALFAIFPTERLSSYNASFSTFKIAESPHSLGVHRKWANRKNSCFRPPFL